MTAKRRDYKAEYRRRNELAKARGFAGYAQQRRAIESGKARAIAPWRIRTKRTAEAQNAFLAELKEQGTYDSYLRAVPIEQQCRDWSSGTAKTPALKYTPQFARRYGLTKAEYTQAYYDAFVNGPESYRNVRRGGSPALRYWLVDVIKLYTAAEYDKRYHD